jgi:hypothetical protein
MRDHDSHFERNVWQVRKMDTNGRIQQIADNKLLTAIARGVQLIGIPLGLLFLAWLAGSVNTLNVQIPQLSGELKSVREIFDMRLGYVEKEQARQAKILERMGSGSSGGKAGGN